MKYMKFFLVVLILLAGPGNYPSQQDSVDRRNDGKRFKLDPNRPSVYLSFEGFVSRKPLREDESGKGIALSLHNNMRTTIRVCSFGVSDGVMLAFPKVDAELAVNYDIARVDLEDDGVSSRRKSSLSGKTPSGYPTGSVCFYTEVSEGKSLAFKVPVEHLADGLSIRVPFRYGWEEESEVSPLHFAVFHESRLPGIKR